MNLKQFIHNRIFFIHGGPGFNNAAEEALLTPRLASLPVETYFWNERSPKGFTELCDQLKNDFSKLNWNEVHIVAHSFALFPTLELLKTEKARIKRLTLVAPPPDLRAVYLQVLKLALQDFELEPLYRPERIQKMRECIGKNRAFFDDFMQEAFAYAAEDRTLFTHYWHNTEVMNAFFKVWNDHQKTVDVDSFGNVSKDLKGKLTHLLSIDSLSLSSFPVDVIFGRHDPIVRKDQQDSPIRAIFSHANEVLFNESGHFPHLEESEKFLNHILNGIHI